MLKGNLIRGIDNTVYGNEMDYFYEEARMSNESYKYNIGNKNY